MVGVATLLTFDAFEAQPLLVDLLVKLLDIKDPVRHEELRYSFPYVPIQSIILMVVLYLTLVPYHRTMFITRTFYKEHETRLSRAMAFTYMAMLGLLPFAFLGMRVHDDFVDGNLVLAGLDLAITLPTMFSFGAYARAS